MFKKVQIFLIAVLAIGNVDAQKIKLRSETQETPKTKINSGDRPKLVVGLVVDQMRWDYLYRFEKKFGKGGFQRLLGEGYSLNNVHIPYIPTVTAIGHTSIYTGSVPSIHQAIRVTGTKRGVLDFLNRIFSRLTVLSWLDDSGVFLVADECKRVNGNRKSKRVAQFKNNE